MSAEHVVYIDSDLEDLVPGFIDHRHQDVEKIQALLAEGNLQEIQRLGHSMKGAGGGYGFDEISRIGQQLEEAAQKGDKQLVAHLNQRLKQYITSVKIVYQEED